MQSPQSNGMHVFVTLWKLDKNSQPVGMTYYAQYENGPAACGWIKASHRELDEKASTPEQPVLLHRHEQKLDGEIVELNVEIWPGSTHFDASEGLRVLIQGTDVMVLPSSSLLIRNIANQKSTRGTNGASTVDHILYTPETCIRRRYSCHSSE